MEVLAAVQALEGADYVETSLTLGWSDTHASGHITRVGERARRELGTWPAADTLVEQLAAALDEAAERETEPERKRGLRTAAAVLGGVARDIAVHVFERKLGI
jgi:hypothetical protein